MSDHLREPLAGLTEDPRGLSGLVALLLYLDLLLRSGLGHLGAVSSAGAGAASTCFTHRYFPFRDLGEEAVEPPLPDHKCLHAQ